MNDTERFIRIITVWDKAQMVFGYDEMAANWLLRPHQLLHGETPFSVAESSLKGMEDVLQILGRLEHGSVS